MPEGFLRFLLQRLACFRRRQRHFRQPLISLISSLSAEVQRRLRRRAVALPILPLKSRVFFFFAAAFSYAEALILPLRWLFTLFAAFAAAADFRHDWCHFRLSPLMIAADSWRFSVGFRHFSLIIFTFSWHYDRLVFLFRHILSLPFRHASHDASTFSRVDIFFFFFISSISYFSFSSFIFRRFSLIIISFSRRRLIFSSSLLLQVYLYDLSFRHRSLHEATLYASS